MNFSAASKASNRTGGFFIGRASKPKQAYHRDNFGLISKADKAADDWSLVIRDGEIWTPVDESETTTNENCDRSIHCLTLAI